MSSWTALRGPSETPNPRKLGRRRPNPSLGNDIFEGRLRILAQAALVKLRTQGETQQTATVGGYILGRRQSEGLLEGSYQLPMASYGLPGTVPCAGPKICPEVIQKSYKIGQN